MLLVHCDKCRKVIEDGNKIHSFKLDGKEYDLCYRCNDAFINWINESNESEEKKTEDKVVFAEKKAKTPEIRIAKVEKKDTRTMDEFFGQYGEDIIEPRIVERLVGKKGSPAYQKFDSAKTSRTNMIKRFKKAGVNTIDDFMFICDSENHYMLRVIDRQNLTPDDEEYYYDIYARILRCLKSEGTDLGQFQKHFLNEMDKKIAEKKAVANK